MSIRQRLNLIWQESIEAAKGYVDTKLHNPSLSETLSLYKSI